MYYHGAAGALLVYDLTRPETFERVKSWVDELTANIEVNDIKLVIVGSKADLIQGTETIEDEANKYAKEIDALYTRTSSKNNTGITC